MNPKILKELIILIGVFLLIWLAFIFIPFRPSAPEAAVTIENEQEIGEILMGYYLDDVNVISDTLVTEAVDKIYDRLLTAIGDTEYDYKIYIVQNDNLNAFASLGGNVVLFSGLLKYADSPEEVAAVLAHEIGHVEKRHVVNKVVKELGVSLVLSLLTGGDVGFLNEILQQSVSTVFDREQESEADDFGLNLLENSNIHPNVMAAIFRRIRDEYSSSTFESLEFLSSHPNTNKRIKKALKYKTQEGFESKEMGIVDWKLIQEAL